MTKTLIGYERKSKLGQRPDSGATWRQLRTIACLYRPRRAGRGRHDMRVTWIGPLSLSSVYTRQLNVTTLRKWQVRETALIPASVVAARPLQWQFRHDAVFTQPVRSFDERTLTDPGRILEAFASANLTGDARRTLVLFAETQRFDQQQRPLLLEHLWDYVIEHRSSVDDAILVAVGAAMRKLVAYWAAARLDELAALVEFVDGRPPARPTEMEFAKALVYRFSWDANAASVPSPRLSGTLHELANFHSSKRALVEPISAAIALNAILALAFMHDARIVEFVRSLPDHSVPWFVSLVRSRAKRIAQELERNRSSGFLPDLATVLPAPVKR